MLLGRESYVIAMLKLRYDGMGTLGCFFCSFFPLFLSDDGQTVAEGDDDFLHSFVFGYEVVEAADALRLVVAGVVWVDDVPVP